MPNRIVTATYRYKRPPRKRKAVLVEGPAIVRARRVGPVERDDGSNVQSAGATAHTEATEAPANDDRKSAIVTVKRRGSRFGDAPDLTPEEHRQRGDAADALFREIVRRAADKDRPPVRRSRWRPEARACHQLAGFGGCAPPA
jgi:hypothetical protein